MQPFLRKWLLLCLSAAWAQRASFVYALWDLDLEAAERELALEWNGSYITWDQHRIAFFKALFPLHPSERKAFWELSNLYERQFERQIAPSLPALAADAYAHRAILHVVEREWLSAGLAAWRSWRILQKAPSQDPLATQWRGLWQVIFATLPPTYQRWLPGTPDIRWEKALLQLRQAAHPSTYTVWESSLLYFFVLRNFDTLATAWLDTCRRELFTQRTPPYLWRFSLALHAFEEGRLGEAESLFTPLVHQPQSRRFPYAAYWLGKLYLMQQQFSQAESLWQRFVLFQTQPFGIAAQYGWRGYIAWLHGDTTGAQQLWQTCLSYKDLLWEEDLLTQALVRRWLERPPDSTEITLWQARWLLHQHQYEAAQATLEPLRTRLQSLTGDQRTALYYLYGRLYHRWQRYEPARFAYFQATRQVPQHNRWMQAYAALYLAQLYEKAADWHNARLYYKEAETIASETGRTGILQKARAGYQRTKDKRYPVPSATH